MDIAGICEAMGAKVEIGDPFDQQETQETINRLMEEEGVKVLILRQSCALSPEKKNKKKYEMRVETSDASAMNAAATACAPGSSAVRAWCGIRKRRSPGSTR